MATSTTGVRVFHSAGWTLFLLALVFAVFTQAFRPLVIRLSEELTPSPPSHPENNSGTVDDPVRRAAVCRQVCGEGATCQQAATADASVFACLTCPGDLLAVGATCVTSPHCELQPWCSTDDAREMTASHNALAKVVYDASGGENATFIVYPYAGDIQATPEWASQLARHFTWPDAAKNALNAYLEGRRQTDNSPVVWFDDQAGWWRTSLSSYLNSVPTPYKHYVDTIMKPVHCQRRWTLDAQTGGCVGPTL